MLALLAVLPGICRGEILTWTGITRNNSADWINADNWTPNVLPAGNDVVISSGKALYNSSSVPASITVSGGQVGGLSNTLSVTGDSSTVPEPSTWLLLVASFFALIPVYRRRAKVA